MLGWFRSRESISAAIIFFYLVPLVAIVGYSLWLPASKTFGVFGIGLLFIAIGSGCLYIIIAQWEYYLKNQTIRPITTPPEEAPYKEPETTNYTPPTEELDQKNAEIKSLLEAQDEYVSESKQSLEVLTQENESLVNQLAHKDNLLEQTEMMIAEIRAESERKQQRINQLETKVRDLSYEIKTLLQLTEIPEAVAPEEKSPTTTLDEATKPYRIEHRAQPEKVAQTPENAASQLKRCIDIAQKMTGASHYSTTNSRFRGIPVDNFALDLRCLFDSLRSENNSTVLFYSAKEHKLLFANEQTRKLTGWSPDKFVQNFEHIVQEGKDEWDNAIKQLSVQSESKVRLILKLRSGEDILVHGLLGTIPTGIFRHHVIAILYSADHRHALSNNI